MGQYLQYHYGRSDNQECTTTTAIDNESSKYKGRIQTIADFDDSGHAIKGKEQVVAAKPVHRISPISTDVQDKAALDLVFMRLGLEPLDNYVLLGAKTVLKVLPKYSGKIENSHL